MLGDAEYVFIAAPGANRCRCNLKMQRKID